MKRRSVLFSPLLLPTLLSTNAIAALAGETVYPEVTPGRRLTFPPDHGAHPDFRTEWWYITGALDSPSPDVGFQLTFFRIRPGIAEDLRSPIAARQILFAHAALVVPSVGLRHEERIARANLGAEFSVDDCDVSIGSWRLRRSENASGECVVMTMESPSFGFDFRLTPSQPLLLQGEDGYSRKSRTRDLASYYVSWPQLQVDGQLFLDGRRRPARGRGWFDHEWSSRVLQKTSRGWDWIGINFNDGEAVMAFRIRDEQGQTVFAQAIQRDIHGLVRHFDTQQVVFTPLRVWSSAHSGAKYPVELEIRLGKRTWRTKPVHDDQELSTRQPRPMIYWEGLVHVEGDGSGRAYLELTGYARKLNL